VLPQQNFFLKQLSILKWVSHRIEWLYQYTTHFLLLGLQTLRRMEFLSRVHFYSIYRFYIYICGPGSSVGIATELRAGRAGDRIPVGGEIFRTCPDRPWGPPSLLYNGYWVFPEGRKRSGRDADPF
jgi:hypothetical protein